MNKLSEYMDAGLYWQKIKSFKKDDDRVTERVCVICHNSFNEGRKSSFIYHGTESKKVHAFHKHCIIQAGKFSRKGAQKDPDDPHMGCPTCRLVLPIGKRMINSLDVYNFVQKKLENIVWRCATPAVLALFSVLFPIYKISLGLLMPSAFTCVGSRFIMRDQAAYSYLFIHLIGFLATSILLKADIRASLIGTVLSMTSFEKIGSVIPLKLMGIAYEVVTFRKNDPFHYNLARAVMLVAMVALLFTPRLVQENFGISETPLSSFSVYGYLGFTAFANLFHRQERCNPAHLLIKGPGLASDELIGGGEKNRVYDAYLEATAESLNLVLRWLTGFSFFKIFEERVGLGQDCQENRETMVRAVNERITPLYKRTVENRQMIVREIPPDEALEAFF